MRKMARNVPKMVVFQREPARPPGRNPSPPGGPPSAPSGRNAGITRATLLPDGCPVGVRQVWTAQGGLKPPCIVTLSMLQPRIVTMRDCTSARSRVSGRVGCGHAARVNLGFRASLEAQLSMVARRLSHRVVAIGHFPPSSDSWHPTHSTHKFTRATAWGGAIPGVRSSDGWLLAHSRESAVALSVIIVHCRQT